MNCFWFFAHFDELIYLHLRCVSRHQSKGQLLFYHQILNLMEPQIKDLLVAMAFAGAGVTGVAPLGVSRSTLVLALNMMGRTRLSQIFANGQKSL
jgi:hypothetical protein